MVKKLAMTAVAYTVVAGMNVFGAIPVKASDNIIDIPVTTIVRGDKGTIKEIASKDVPQDYRGRECTVHTASMNQSSVHPGNNLIIASGNDSVVLEDVERAANVSTTADGKLTLGNTIKVSVQLGQDRVFSAGMTVSFECEEPEVCEFNPQLPADDPKCFEPCEFDSNLPVNDPNCKEDEEVCEFDDSLPANDPNCKEDEVCEFDPTLPVDDPNCKEDEEVLGEVKELPNTGPASLIVSVLGAGVAAGSVDAFIRSKRR